MNDEYNDQSPFRAEEGAAGDDFQPVAVPAWEDRQQLGVIRSAFQTITEVLGRPTQTYGQMSPRGDLGSAILFFLLITIMVQLLLGLMAIPSMAMSEQMTQFSQSQAFENEYMSPEMREMMEMITPSSQNKGIYLLQHVVLGPIMAVISMLIWAGITHVLLLLLGGTNEPFDTSLRVFAYGIGACSVVQLVPCCGYLVYLVVVIINLTIGLSQLHRTENWKPAMALLVPIFLLVTCCVGVGVLGLGGLLIQK